MTGDVHLIGMVHGHWDVRASDINSAHPESRDQSGVNLGIALVIPMEKIMETINQPELKEIRERNKAEYFKIFGPRGD